MSIRYVSGRGNVRWGSVRRGSVRRGSVRRENASRGTVRTPIKLSVNIQKQRFTNALLKNLHI